MQKCECLNGSPAPSTSAKKQEPRAATLASTAENLLFRTDLVVALWDCVGIVAGVALMIIGMCLIFFPSLDIDVLLQVLGTTVALILWVCLVLTYLSMRRRR